MIKQSVYLLNIIFDRGGGEFRLYEFRCKTRCSLGLFTFISCSMEKFWQLLKLFLNLKICIVIFFEWFNPINLFINNLDSFDDGQKRKKKNRKITKDTKGKGTQSNERLRTKRQVKTKEFKGRRQRSLKKGDKGRQKRTTTDGKEGRQRMEKKDDKGRQSWNWIMEQNEFYKRQRSVTVSFITYHIFYFQIIILSYINFS